MKNIKAIVVGILSGIVAVLVIHLNLNTWVTMLLIGIIVLIFSTMVSHRK